MKCITILFLVSLLAEIKGAPSKHTSGVRDGRIVGGKKAIEGEFPFLVSIVRYGHFLHCSGTIINEEWVLTAGHCTSYYPMKAMTFRAGSLKWAAGGSKHKPIAQITHPKFVRKSSGQYINDIALYKVSPPFVLENQTVASIPLADEENETFCGNKSLVAGWGSTRYGGPISAYLQKASIPVISQEKCFDLLQISEKELCAGYPDGGIDSCQGDSGGPLIMDGIQHGIVSWGNGCADARYPGVYTKISAYRQWITENSGV